MGCNPLALFIVRVTIAFIGIVVGIAAGLVFVITYDNIHAAGWAGVSSLFALISLIVIVLVYKKKLNDWGLTLFALIGATGIVLASTAFVLYIVLGFYDKDKPSLPKSYYVVPVWAFMVFKHSTVMTWVTSYELVKIYRQRSYQQVPTPEELD